MPLIEDKGTQVAFSRLINDDPTINEIETPDFTELLSASFQLDNTIGSALAEVDNLPDRVIENASFNPWDNLTEDEKLDDQFTENAIRADNMEQLEAVRAQSANERKLRQTLTEGGALSFATGLIAGVADPINLIPVGGTAYKTYKTGSSILRAGLATASVAAGTTAITEAALHHTQLERTYGESAVNVTAGALLGGAIGASVAGIAQMLGRGGDDAITKILKEVEDSLDPERKISQGANPLYGSGSVGAAQVDIDIEVKGKIARALTKALGWDPLSQTLTSQNKSTRFLATELAENPIAMENKSGNFVPNAVETAAKTKDGLYYKAIESHYKSFDAYRKAGGPLKRQEFNALVSREMRNPSPATDANIKAAADSWRKELYEPLKQELIDTGLLPDDVSVGTAVSYLNRSWNKEKIRGGLDSFVGKVSTWLKEKEQLAFARGKEIQAELKALNKQVDSLNKKGQRADKKMFARLNELEDLYKPIKGKIDRDLTDDEFKALALEISTRITSTPDGRLPYDYQIGENMNKGKGGGGGGLKGPLQTRSFTIPDELVEEFLENDIEQLGGRYLKALAVDIELTKRFGDIDMTAQIKQVSDDWDLKIQEASKTDAKLARKLGVKKDNDIKNIAAMRDRMRGVWGDVDQNNIFVRTGRVIRDLNYLRFMGGVVASSVPDLARIVMSNGIVKTFKNGLKPLITNTKAFNIAANEAKKYGVGVDVLMGGRSEILADVADYSQGGTAIERGTRSLAQSFGKINLMDYWTAGTKQLHAVVAQTDMANILTAGKFDHRLRQLGISEANGKAIGLELKKYGKNDSGVWIANTKDWESQELAQLWGNALRKESDAVIVIPGQEKPLFMSTEMGKTFFQFRSFMFAATQRMLIRGIQQQDQNYMQGLVSMVSLGMMAYAFKQWDAGRELSDDPANWVVEGIDRSGVTGIIMEINNTVEKISANNFGLRPLLGITTPSSRFASRSQAEAFMGPTFGSFLTTLLESSGGLADGEIDEKDVRSIRRLIPYQNLILFRQLIDKLEETAQ